MTNYSEEVLGQTKELLKSVGKSKRELVIGIPKETVFQEKRIALTPLSVALLVEYGHRVIIESGAGDSSNFLDHHYSEQGAQIVHEKERVYNSDIVIKIAGPRSVEHTTELQ